MTITDQAKAWGSFLAKNVKVSPAENANQYMVVGTTLLDKEAFNRINDDDHDVVHGVQVVYGPFSSRTAVQEFVAEYAGSEYQWPGHHDWKYFHIGNPYILTPMTNPDRCDIVHNKSLEFQGQLELNEQRKRIEEIEKTKERLRERELNNFKPIEKEELDVRISWVQGDVDRRKLELEQEQSHLNKLLDMRSKFHE